MGPTPRTLTVNGDDPGLLRVAPDAARRDLPRALSGTHQHLLGVLNTELGRRMPMSRPIRILDAGCGDGLLLEYLSQALSVCWPDQSFELHGFDVSDHGLQQQGYFAAALLRLAERAPSQDWNSRLVLISERDDWPYPDGFFDVVVSNQVLEHVADHRFFFAQNARVLHTGGFSVHLFPSVHCIRDPHLLIPFVHWFGSTDAIIACIKIFSRLGLGRYKSWAKDAVTPDLDRYAREHADFVIRLTNYQTQRALLSLAKAAKLQGSFRYTPRYYTEKLRSLAGTNPSAIYRPAPGPLSSLAAIALRYVASVTLLVERDESYDRRPEIRRQPSGVGAAIE